MRTLKLWGGNIISGCGISTSVQCFCYREEQALGSPGGPLGFGVTGEDVFMHFEDYFHSPNS